MSLLCKLLGIYCAVVPRYPRPWFAPMTSSMVLEKNHSVQFNVRFSLQQNVVGQERIV